jgi:hypothetical protein
MASPKVVCFFLFNESTGAPLTGATPTFTTYKNTDGTDVANPSITEIGGGVYKFTPIFPTDKGLVFVVNGGAGSTPRYQSAFLRPEDYNLDALTDLQDEMFGKWEIPTIGPDTNRLVLYRQDGITVLKKFDLLDSSGSPSSVNVFSRIPV